MLQHFLPATYLASFSEEDTLPRRDRQIWVGDRQTRRCFARRVGQVAAVNDLYILSHREYPHLLESVWQQYEAQLADATAQLLEGTITASTWAQVLVPFVACLFVRGPDFNERFEARLRGLEVPLPDDNTNRARLLELQRTLAPIAAAKWTLFEAVGDESVIASDLGFAPFMGAPTGEVGVAIPLDRRHILGIVPKTEWPVATASGDEWYPCVQYITLDPGNHQAFNRAVADSAQRWIYGPDAVTIERYLPNTVAGPPLLDLMEMGFLSSREQRAHEFTWHRLVSALAKNPSVHEPDDFEIDYAAIAAGWAPPIIFPTNFPFCPPELLRRGDTIYVKFYDPEPYYGEVKAVALDYEADYDGVIAVCTEALQTAFELRQIVKLRSLRGKAYDELGRYDLALQDFNVSLELDEADAAVHVDRCITLLKQESLAEAISACTRAIEISPGLGEAYSNRAIAYYQNGESDNAMDDFNQAVHLLEDGPVKARVLLNRGYARLGPDTLHDALQDFTAALGLFEEEHAERAACHYGRAVCHGRLGNTILALRDLDDAIALDPSYTAALHLRELVRASM